MRNDFAKAQYVGLARPAKGGALLRLGPEPLSVCWTNPSRGVHVTGLGVAGEGGGEVRWLSPVPPAIQGPWFGGWAFDSSRLWEGYDAERWILPEVMAWWDGTMPWVAAFGIEGTPAVDLERRLDAIGEVEPFTAHLSSRVTAASKDVWAENIERALLAISRGRFEKVVLARAIELECERDFPERAVLKALEGRHPQCWSFLVRGKDGSAFVGASPELLGEGRGSLFVTEALAGTAAGGHGRALLDNDKERREHLAVIEGICESLRPFVTELECGNGPSVRKLANVDHLFTPIRATLKDGVAHLDVLRALHPTPAVAGRPRGETLNFLRAQEDFSRGWYAGAVGAMGPQGVTMAVALRSALLRGASAQVFVGAGIVAGSTAEGEWVETERKSKAMLPALGVHDG